jgi:hypothetical protein
MQRHKFSAMFFYQPQQFGKETGLAIYEHGCTLRWWP